TIVEARHPTLVRVEDVCTLVRTQRNLQYQLIAVDQCSGAALPRGRRRGARVDTQRVPILKSRFGQRPTHLGTVSVKGAQIAGGAMRGGDCSMAGEPWGHQRKPPVELYRSWILLQDESVLHAKASSV